MPWWEKTKRLRRIVGAFGESHPKHVNRRAEFHQLEVRLLVRDRVPSVGADYKVGSEITLAIRRFRSHAGHAIAIEKQIDNFVLHMKRERWKALRFA